MKKNCLTCKWEPVWSGWTSGEYSRCYGRCRFPVKAQLLPATHSLIIKPITRYTDDSGVPEKCRTWEPEI